MIWTHVPVCRLDGSSSMLHRVNVIVFVVEFVRIWRQFINSSVPCLHCSLMTDSFTIIAYDTSSDSMKQTSQLQAFAPEHYPDAVSSNLNPNNLFSGDICVNVTFHILLDLWNYHFKRFSYQNSMCTFPFLYKETVTPHFISPTWHFYLLIFRSWTTMFEVLGLV